MTRIDLHVHSTASDGEYTPRDVVRLARAADLDAIALTDHDTLAGVADAQLAGEGLDLRVIAGCEFSVAAPWGELHLLGYFVPVDDRRLETFLDAQRAARRDRMEEIVRRLGAAGVPLRMQDVLDTAGSAALGRPHAARALVATGAVRDVDHAFRRFLGFGRAAYVPKRLPALREVTDLIRDVGGVSSAAHLKERASRATLEQLRAQGVDAVEVRHPSHDEATTRRIDALAAELDLLPSGGSDWHGTTGVGPDRARLGAMDVPPEWLDGLEARARSRQTPMEEMA